MSWDELLGPTLPELLRADGARGVLVVAGALLAGLAAYALTGLVLDAAHRRSLKGRLSAFLADGDDRFEALGNSLLRRMSAQRQERWFGLFAHQRRWAALDGEEPSLPRLLGIAAVALLCGVLGLVNQIPALMLVAAVAAVAPFVRLRARVRRVRKSLERSLPELLSLMSAEMAAGVPPEQALARAGEFGGPLAAIIRLALHESRQSRRPMFSHGEAQGTWREVVERYRLPSLRAFALQIEIAARKGAAGPELMESLSRSLILSYKDKALREAEKFESRLAVPSVLFFFLPLMALVLAPMMVPLLDSLT